MPITNLRPLAIGTDNAFTLGAGGSKPVAVDAGDPVSHDEFTTYIQEVGASNVQQSFTCTNKPPPGSILVSQPINRARATCSQAAQPSFGLYHRTNAAAAGHSGFSTTGSFADYGATVARAGGGAFTIDDIMLADFQMGCGRENNSGALGIFCTSMWVEVNYQPPPGAWTEIISGLGPFVALCLAEMPRVARALWRQTRGGIWIHPHEHVDAWRELRADRHPVRFDLGRA